MRTIQDLIDKGLNAVSDDHVFLEQNDRRITSLELKKDIAALAGKLKTIGAHNGDAVTVFAYDRIAMIEGMLGVLKAACVFVPVEGDYPPEMVQDMLEIAKVKYIFTDEQCYEKAREIAGDRCKVIKVEEAVSEKDERGACEVDGNTYNTDDPIYVYFTSGTTGKPKAILGKNKGLVHFIEWEGRKVNQTGINVSQITSPCHDPFLRDIFLPILLGGKICIPAEQNVILDGKRLVKWVKEAGVNVLHCTPSVVNHLLSGISGHMDYPDLKYVFMAGEKISPKLLSKWYDLTSSHANLVSLYGPTETTLAKLCYDITPNDCNAEIIPLGKPIDDTDVYICNDNMEECCPGVEGEIVISTEYATYGYLCNDELNVRSFAKDAKAPGKTMYKTGDLGRIKPDGNIEFLGRKDSQVKIRGNRVELNYVEAKILEMQAVKECVLTFNDETLGKEYIAAYVVAGESCSKSDIIEWLKAKVPVYMFPTYIVFMDKLPLNKNMKVDKKSLPDPTVGIEAEDATVSETEGKLIEAFKEILDAEAVSTSDSFFALGGSSLNVMTLISRIYDDFQVEISLAEIFDSFSLSDLACVIDEKLAVDAGGADMDAQTFSRSEYQEKKNKGYFYDVKDAGSTTKVIKGIVPFNDIFYRSCLYNSIFSVVNYYGAGILPILTNDIVMYRPVDKLTLYEKMDFVEDETLESVVGELGVELKQYEVKENVIQRIIAAIDADKPVIIGVDCFYESIRPDFYLKENWPHNILVYGYDNAKQEMIVMEHTGVNNLDYQEQRLSYLDLEYAYHSNRIKYAKTESKRYYLECAKIPVSAGAEAVNCYGEYRSRIKAHMEDITLNLEELPALLEYIEGNVSSSERIKDNPAWIAKLLDAIVEAKKAQSYLLDHIDGVASSEPTTVIEAILKKWKFIRNALYKYLYTEEYDSELMNTAVSGLKEIQNLEFDFYNSIVCP